MAAQVKIFLSDGEELQDLRQWMSGHAGIVVEAVPRAATPNAQGSGWDFLSIVFAEGGAVVAGMRALQLWITSRVTVIKVVTPEGEFEVTGTNPQAVLPQLTAVITKAVESGEARRDEPS